MENSGRVCLDGFFFRYADFKLRFYIMPRKLHFFYIPIFMCVCSRYCMLFTQMCLHLSKWRIQSQWRGLNRLLICLIWIQKSELYLVICSFRLEMCGYEMNLCSYAVTYQKHKIASKINSRKMICMDTQTSSMPRSSFLSAIIQSSTKIKSVPMFFPT